MDLYFECSAGISGDMTVAALLDLGADKNVLQQALESIPLQGFKTEITRVSKNGIDCCNFNVILDEANFDHDMDYLFGHQNDSHNENSFHHHEHNHQHRCLKDIKKIITDTNISQNAKNLSIKVFEILASAEAKAHGTTPDKVHFHEVGAIDSIVDIIAFAVCFDNLKVQKVYVPSVFEGCGTIRCQHGILPIPVPAVTNIFSEYRLCFAISNEKGEFITPTGAAFLAAIQTNCKLPSVFSIKATGLGAGKRNYTRPSILRIFQIETNSENNDISRNDNDFITDQILQLETNIDDCSGEALGFVMNKLFEAGAKDVFYTPVFMKKNRPAYLLTVLCPMESDLVSKIQEIIFLNTTSIGIRKSTKDRTILPREILNVQTKYGTAKVKKVLIGEVIRYYPEYESILELCNKTGLDYQTIYQEVANIHG